MGNLLPSPLWGEGWVRGRAAGTRNAGDIARDQPSPNPLPQGEGKKQNSEPFTSAGSLLG